MVITGGSRGLGLQMAREFGNKGARVVICARDENELDRAKKDLNARNIRTHTMVCDVSDRVQSARLIAETIRLFGGVDVLVNSAGLIEAGPIYSMQVEDFEQAMGVIFWGALYPIVAALPNVREKAMLFGPGNKRRPNYIHGRSMHLRRWGKKPPPN